jgi:hypothetical protein
MMQGLPIKRFLCLAILILGSRAVPAAECQNVPLINQQQSNWCWAAASQMVRLYWAPASGARQCDYANYAGSQGACNIPSGNICCDANPSCNFTCTPQIQRDYSSTLLRNGSLSRNDVSYQLGSPCQPFIFIYLLQGGIPHARVARGFMDTPWGTFIHINDPNPLLQDQTYILYNDYAANSTQSWYNIHP